MRLKQTASVFLAGLLAVVGFAPFFLFPVPLVALAVLFVHWQRAHTARAAAVQGFAFGLGLFGGGVGWIYVALHDYGGMPFLLAIVATGLFASVLALFPALAGYAQTKWNLRAWVRLVAVMPALWVVMEWLRGLIFTGFPWLAFGYSQVPGALAGYAPVLGVYGVSLVLAVCAGLLALLWQQVTHRKAQESASGTSLEKQVRLVRYRAAAIISLAVLVVAGMALRAVEWTQAQGGPIRVSLVQGNIPQELKFEESRLVGTLETYRRLIQQSDARLIVLPETALPLLRNEVPENYASILREHVRRNGGDIIIGAFERDHRQYFNSAFTLGTAESQSYRKNHLVPFGEFIPLRPVLGWFINEVLSIPMSDLSRGGITQPPLNVAGQKVAVNICYEDVFGEEIIRALPEATLLVNLSNDAWYGHSHAAMQHNQISQMRALETGRMMLRATNTGVTSIIGRDGRIVSMLPQHEEGVLTGQVQGYSGSTPYVRWGNALVLLMISGMLAFAWAKRR